MKLIFALGNPEKKYDNTRHNIGYEVVEAFAEKQKVTFQQKDKFKARIAETMIGGKKVLLVKPTTYYNLVGESYQLITDFYKLESKDTLIIYDELALPFGTLRTRWGGSDAGNNGIKSINSYGGEGSARLRVGIANDKRALVGDTDFVIGKFSKTEQEQLSDIVLPAALTQIHVFMDRTFTAHSIKTLAEPASEQEKSDQD